MFSHAGDEAAAAFPSASESSERFRESPRNAQALDRGDDELGLDVEEKKGDWRNMSYARALGARRACMLPFCVFSVRSLESKFGLRSELWSVLGGVSGFDDRGDWK